jgi:MFS family permease
LQASVSAIHAGGFGLGATFGPILGSVLTATIGYRLAFTVTAGIVFVMSFFHLGSQFFYTRLSSTLSKKGQEQKEEHLLTSI